jgi:lipopolysaccharide/colanic/teichoic acid biosynthesis glycosyltransferase/nucleoside-diphosphate-sugar epimerase
MTESASELKGKRVLVTGASGFVGSRLVKALLDSEAEVFALVDEDAVTERIEPLMTNRGLHLIRCTLSDMPAISAPRSEWRDIEYLVHLWLKVPASQDFCDQSIEDINMNLLPAINLVRALSLRGICFASSVSVYGFPARTPVRESDLPAPISSYGATKLAIENFFRSYGTARNVPVTVLRYATVYGPGEHGHRAIPNFTRDIAAGQPPSIYGDGSEIRDYIYVDDIVQATTLAITAGKNQVLNIGSGRGHTTLEIAQKIMELYPAAINPRFIPGNRRNINLICDISAAKEALSFSPQTTLEDGLRQEIAWYKEQMEQSPPKDKGQPAPAPERREKSQGFFSYAFLKSIIDRFIAFLGITVLSPLLSFIAIMIKIDSHESPIFTQERIGKDGCKFNVYKFRTMHANNDDSKYKAYLSKYVLENAPYRVDQNGQRVYKVDDCQVTRFGKFLRKTNLDELPQFFNVLKGEMSLVGPRPDVPFAVQMYRDRHRERLRVKPGITGLWQVCGRKELSFEDMVSLDVEYIKKQSLFLDIKILFQTIGIVLDGDGS